MVGLLEEARYEQGSVQLRPGDILVAFTDGISEAMNLADDEWGEERLMESMSRVDLWNHALIRAGTMECTFAAATQFAEPLPSTTT